MNSKIKTFFRLFRSSRTLLSYVSDDSCSVENFIARNRSCLPDDPYLSVDLGAGFRPQNPFNLRKCVGVDHNPNSKGVFCDLSKGVLPFQEISVSVLTAFHFIEHLPRISVNEQANILNPFLALMNDSWRVLVPGGLFLSVTPAYPFGAAFSDPTHVNFITEKTFRYYLCGDKPYASQYGYSARFHLIDQAWSGESLMSLLMKVD